jgi:molybdopterin synthase sulfur carrier subunit
VTVTLQLPGALAPFAGGQREVTIAAGGGTTVCGVLDRLAGQLPVLERRIRDERAEIRRHVNVYVNGVDIRTLSGAESPVPDGAVIDIIAAVSGG